MGVLSMVLDDATQDRATPYYFKLGFEELPLVSNTRQKRAQTKAINVSPKLSAEELQKAWTEKLRKFFCRQLGVDESCSWERLRR